MWPNVVSVAPESRPESHKLAIAEVTLSGRPHLLFGRITANSLSFSICIVHYYEFPLDEEEEGHHARSVRDASVTATAGQLTAGSSGGFTSIIEGKYR